MRSVLSVLGLLAIVLFSCGESSKELDGVQEVPVETIPPGYAELDSLTQLLKISPNDPNLLNARAKVFLNAGELDYALADVGRAILIDSSNAEYFITISDVYFQRNEPKRCLNALKIARRLAPKNLDALNGLARFNIYLENYQESIDLANEMLTLESKTSRPFVIKAICYQMMKDTTRAIENYMLAAERDPDNAEVQLELGVLHWGKRDPLAQAFLQNAVAISPEMPQALYALGMAYQDNGKFDEAMETYNRLIELDSAHANAIYNIGYIHYQYLDEHEEALSHFNRAVKAKPNYYEAVYMRGLCYEAMGDNTRAKQEYGYALRLNPNYGLAAKGMERLVR